MDSDLLHEQLAYYSARAQEYDASLGDMSDAAEGRDPGMVREWSLAVRALHALGTYPQVLELAGGTGIWTQELLAVSKDLTVLDGSPEMLAINRSKLVDPRVQYQCVDLFSWEPQRDYDLVFFAFWLCHVPPDRLAAFLDKVSRAVRPGGRLFIVDEPAGGRHLSGPSEAGMYQRRTLEDGRAFNIVKVYYDPLTIQGELGERGFVLDELVSGEYFFHLVSTRLSTP